MAPKRKVLQTRRKIRPRAAGVCEFCRKRITPDYKDYKFLQKYQTDRAKIVGRDFSGVCSKHQRKLSVAIKRARHLGLLPFVASV